MPAKSTSRTLLTRIVQRRTISGPYLQLSTQSRAPKLTRCISFRMQPSAIGILDALVARSSLSAPGPCCKWCDDISRPLTAPLDPPSPSGGLWRYASVATRARMPTGSEMQARISVVFPRQDRQTERSAERGGLSCASSSEGRREHPRLVDVGGAQVVWLWEGLLKSIGNMGLLVYLPYRILL